MSDSKDTLESEKYRTDLRVSDEHVSVSTVFDERVAALLPRNPEARRRIDEACAAYLSALAEIIEDLDDQPTTVN